jgi:hypothetical protein
LTALVAAGCADSTQTDAPNAAASNPAAAAAPDATYVLATEPEGAAGVGEVRESSNDKDEVTVVGRIGGSEEPFVDGLAAFTIVDPKVAHCSEEEGCPTPWDYCCTQNEVKDNIATVRVVDDQGQLVAQDAKELLGVKELSTVVVKGTAQRDDQGNLTVLAEKVFVKE